MVDFEFGVYRKPGNAYVYLPYGSYHSRHVFREWLKAEMPHTQALGSGPTGPGYMIRVTLFCTLRESETRAILAWPCVF